MLGAETNAVEVAMQYDLAQLAVIGTLAGSLLTGIFASIAAVVSARAQRKNLAAQLEHASLEANREAQRAVYAEFIDCMERWNLLALRIEEEVIAYDERKRRHKSVKAVEATSRSHATPAGTEGTPAPSTNDGAAEPRDDENDALHHADLEEFRQLREEADALWDRWRDALGRLQLLASVRVDQLAHAIFGQYNNMMDSAWRGEFDISGEAKESKIYPVTLTTAMREDVGIKDNYSIDPATGLRVEHPSK